MSKITYYIKRILSLDYQRLFVTVSQCHKKCGKNSVYLFFDIIYCGFRYGAGYNDYKLCEFYNLTAAQRTTYVTRAKNNQIVKMLNNKNYYHYFNDKIEFNTKFEKYLGRDWLDFNKCSYDDFCSFVKSHPVFMAKPSSLNCGQGIEKINTGDYESIDTLYEHLKTIKTDIVEQYIIQHNKISQLYPYSVNTLRVVTVLSENTAHIVYAFIRIGNNNNVVDNLNHGGMTAPIDLETGEVLFPAFDKESKFYNVHPQTNVSIIGFKIPFWQESKKLVLEAALVIPQVGYVGWDVAVTDEKPTLIEANQFPGHDILQLPPHVPDKIGMLPEFQKYIKI